MNRSHAPKMMHLLMVLSLLLGGQTAWAQTVHWSSGYPSLDNDRVVTLESERTLRIRLAALGSDISNATIVITLPAGIDYVAGSATPTSPGITLSENLVGSVLTLTVGGDGKLPLNQEKEFHLKVKAATCVSPAAVSFGVEVQSSGTAVPNGTKAVQANIVQPILTLTPQQAVVNFTSQTQTQTITYYLKATTVDKASSARISFTTPDATTTLTNFKVKGAAVTPTASRRPTLPAPEGPGSAEVGYPRWRLRRSFSRLCSGGAPACGQSGPHRRRQVLGIPGLAASLVV